MLVSLWALPLSEGLPGLQGAVPRGSEVVGVQAVHRFSTVGDAQPLVQADGFAAAYSNSNVGRHKEQVCESHTSCRCAEAVKTGAVLFYIGCVASKSNSRASFKAKAVRLRRGCHGRWHLAAAKQHAAFETSVARPFKLSWCRRWRAVEGKC